MAKNQGTSNDTKTIVTILLLIFIFPVGLILMWVWIKWKLWVKILVSIPIIALLAAGVLTAFSPSRQIERANCVKKCQTNDTNNACMQACMGDDNEDGRYSEFTTQDSNEVLDQINAARQERGLSPVRSDENVCKYVRWLTTQYKNKGSDYANLAHTSEIAKPEIQFAYFKDYKSVYRAAIGTSEENNQKIGDKLVSSPSSNALRPDVTNGCVYGALSNDETKWWVVFVGASKK